MRCLVTCGPTYENLDQVRRLTNFSTGQLGIGLANHLHAAGHQVTLLKGSSATCCDPVQSPVTPFTTTDDLLSRLRSLAASPFAAVFHAAAVSDFRFGSVFRKASTGLLEPLASGKLSTRDGNLLAELIPTPKIISHLRTLFPAAMLFGWKYEVDGDRESALQLGEKQIAENLTNYAVINGPAYGKGFGIIGQSKAMQHCRSSADLYHALLHLASGGSLQP